MELVYPIYIDTPMMTSFLASLEGGLIEETALEEKTATGTEKDKIAGGGAKISGLLSSVLSLEAKAEMSQKSNDTTESNYKSTVRFPEASLFIRLRELLKQEGLVRQFDASNWDGLKFGELIEFSGTVSPNPAFQIRRFSEHLSPIIESMTNMEARQLESQMQILEKAKPNQRIKLGDEEINLATPSDINLQKKNLRIQIDEKKNASQDLKGIMDAIECLMPDDQIDKLIFSLESSQAVCFVYPDFARNQRVQDIHYANWKCIGKVIGKVEKGQSYDLLRGMPAGYFASTVIDGLSQTLMGKDINLDLTEPNIQGPAFVVAALAIFS